MLKDYPKELVTKDGTPIVLRPVQPEDEERLAELFARIPEDERWFLREDIEDPEGLRQWISDPTYRKVVPLVAVKEPDRTIIANVRIHKRASDCLRHIGHLRIVVDPHYRQQRLGTWMLLDAVKLATALGLEKLVAEFVEGVEEAAIKAAGKLDFHQEAVLKEYIKDRQGNYLNLIIMVKDLQREWSDF